MSKCIKCGSYAFNLYKEEIDQGGLCDVHYWQGRAHRAEALAEQPAQQQEPYGWIGENSGQFIKNVGQRIVNGTPLYTSPQPAQPSKPWVGLTDEDIKEAEWLLSAIKEHEAYTLQEQLLVEGVDVFARAIEAKLRERNT